ncbi:MAG: hypothetical protein E6K18_06850 [Methanobacteriota archaeon]|nr:MAG: hypothetical protein E6K18_06850 [Euryarchaeota archaeon]
MADESPAMKRLAARFYLLLILVGLFFYVSWSLVYNTWDLSRAENMGVYALTIILLGFGVTGYLLYREPRPKSEPPKGT